MPAPRTSRKQSRRSRRIRHNGAIFAATAAGSGLLLLVLPHDLLATQAASILLGYASLVLLLATLTIGPRRLLLGRRNPVSDDLRRDMGIWCGAAGVSHVVFAVQHHFGGAVVRYFFVPGRLSPATLRRDAFGLGSDSGLVATALLVMLVAISNDRSLRRLGRRWKTLQRANYALALLSLAHTALFWRLLHRNLAIVGASAVAALAVAALQGFGVARHRRAGSPHTIGG